MDLCQIPVYQSFTEQKTWENARDACTALGTGYSLAAITNSVEEAMISSVSTVRHWIGANDKNSEGSWQWVQGPNHINEEIVYSNWSSGEPNNAASGEDCAERLASTSKWNDLPCSELRAYICQYREGL